ncbi:hypothetical protein FXO38_31045 [Capsicum annuum]|uniref:Uncharacterized protein n=1 Tax=Capsicum annuum TaxID=4072 RepID=A0A2G3A2I5_CAPAN|nr:hypothetical protein FXO38_31045 [Capsicum annuum]PHT88444.1 hypothetical protein T459_10550 [Capsicum annuum]
MGKAPYTPYAKRRKPTAKYCSQQKRDPDLYTNSDLTVIKFLPKSGQGESDQFGNGASKAQLENAAKKELDSEATHASRKRAWKPNFLNKPDEGYDHAWSSGGRRSKAHNLLKGRGKPY